MNQRLFEPLEGRRLLALLIDYPMEEGQGILVADAADDAVYGRQDAMLLGGATWEQPGRVGGHAISLNGVDASLGTDDLGPILGRSSSLAVWIKTTQVGGADAASSPGLVGGDNGMHSIYWGWIDECGRTNFTVPGTPPPGGRDTVTSDFPVNDGNWYHIAMTRDIATGEIALYVNGLLHDSALADKSPRDDLAIIDVGRIAGVEGAPRFLQASIDELKIYDSVLSPAVTFDPTGVPPATPTNLRMLLQGPRTLRFVWDNDPRASGYEIWRAKVGEGFENVAFAAPNGGYTDTGLEPSTSYAYRIRAVNPHGTSGSSETIIGTTFIPDHLAMLVTGSDGDDQIRVELRGEDAYIWNSAKRCCGAPYHIESLEYIDEIVIDAGAGLDSITVDAGDSVFFPHRIIVNAGAHRDDIRLSGRAQFVVHADTGFDDLMLGGGAIVLFEGDQRFDDWTFNGPASIRFDRAKIEVNEITPDPGTHIDIGRGTLSLFKPDNEPLMLRRLHELARTARSATPPWGGGVGLTSSAIGDDPLLGVAVGMVTKMTYTGDVNLDGFVDADDYFAIDSGFLTRPRDVFYRHGDFNYDGTIDADDYFLIDRAFLGQSGPPTSASAALAASAAGREEATFSRRRVRATPARGHVADSSLRSVVRRRAT